MNIPVNRKQIIRALLFLTIGVFIFWYVYRDTNIKELKSHLTGLNYWWIGVSILLNLISQYIRAIRWKLLIQPMGYHPSRKVLFVGILVLCVTNLVIPRGGEVTRGAVVSKYSHVPFPKLLGTVVVERIIDLVMLVVLFATALIWLFPYFTELLNLPSVRIDFSNLTPKLITTAIVVLIIGFVVWLYKKTQVFGKLKTKIAGIKDELIEGIQVFKKVRHKTLYIALTILVYGLWLIMLYVIFFAYGPTSHLSFAAAAFTFAAATFAFLVPVQAGMGAWHFMVVQGLLLFGIGKTTGLAFALIAHTFTNLIYLAFGGVALAFLPFMDSKK